jgi:hypothetical protein
MVSATDDRTLAAYPFAVVRLQHNWSAGASQWSAAVTAPTREALDQRMAEAVAVYLHDLALEGQAPEAPKAEHCLDLSAYREAGEPCEVVYVAPAPLSAFAIAIERGLLEEGVSQAELARRMGVAASVVSRITVPLYFGHTSKAVRAVADALGREVHICLRPKRADTGALPTSPQHPA